jgi:hypothetical protein
MSSRKRSSSPSRRRHRRREPAWTRLSDEELLKLRFCDLKLSVRNPMIERALRAVREELRRRGIRLRPHVWLSVEWFSPDGIPGIAIPFYLAHPRLMRLERQMIGEVEGGNARWMLRILRHEVGHALDNAFRLRRRNGWRKTFGKASHPYPSTYHVRPASRNYVLHLGHWYAQSHPTEDFAETFAVWMQPKARWRREYQGWPALAKLEYVDWLMTQIRGERPLVDNRDFVEPISENMRTLAEHYRRKRNRYHLDTPDAYDLRLKRVFGKRREGQRHLRASTFVRESRPQLERLLMRRSRLYPYLVHHVLRTVIQRCRELDLVVDTSKRDAKRAVLGVLERIMVDILRRDQEQYTL